MSSRTTPLLIAGPTASGKSELAINLAERDDGIIINADALQVYDCWRVLTARPGDTELARAPHRLFGHVSIRQPYSVGAWLRDVELVLQTDQRRPIIVGGTGLYFHSLLNGLSDIPEVPASIRRAGNEMRAGSGTSGFVAYLARFDPETLAGLDRNNPMRLQRAWEVHQTTGTGLSDFHKTEGKPLINIDNTERIVLSIDPALLRERIERRFEAMLDTGAIEECQRVIAGGWDAKLPSARALGAAEIIRFLGGEISLAQARELAIIATRRYAKRQRTWFRSRMQDWTWVAEATDLLR